MLETVVFARHCVVDRAGWRSVAPLLVTAAGQERAAAVGSSKGFENACGSVAVTGNVRGDPLDAEGDETEDAVVSTWMRWGRLLCAGAVAVALAVSTPTAATAATQNPIIGDGSVYSADPTLLVADDTLYLHAGRDEAGENINDFVMNEWQAFSTTDVDGGEWEHHPSLMRPEEVFDWATPGRAYAGQVVEGTDGRFYWYVPVHEAASTADDKFGIGVAVSDTPLGPWTDHADRPIVSQTILDNDAHNIDPTVLVDDGRVWMHWGSFGRLQAIELAADMKTLVGSPTQITSGVTGFFEAPWLFERDDTYYLAYAANNAGPASGCTEATYHACIAYSTSPSPLGPWTHRGRILAPVSSTTSHPAIAEFQGQWYMAYHTADAEGGNHFRRSVAIDELNWDETQTPARILPVVTTPAHGADQTPRSNVAPWATVSASNEPIPTQYWIKALNDELVRPNPLPPDMWGSWTASRPAQEWIQYDWTTPVRVDRARIQFWRDTAPGTGDGVADPAAWRLQYWEAGEWKDVREPSGYPTSTREMHEVTFEAVTTSRLRAVLDAAPGPAGRYSAVAVEEWEVHAVQPDGVAAVTATTVAGVAPDLPTTVALEYAGEHIAAPVQWDAIDEAAYAAAGTFTVSGFVEGYAAGRISAEVVVRDEHPWRTNLALTGAAAAQSTATGATTAALNDGVVAYDGAEAAVWRPDPRSGEPGWAGYSWAAPVVVDTVTAHFWTADDLADLPAAWAVQVRVDGVWTDVSDADAAPIEAGAASTVTFAPIAADAVRVMLTPQDGGASPAALGELEVLGEPQDALAPEVTLTTTGVAGAEGWFVSPVTIRAAAIDDHDQRTTIDFAVGDAPWRTTTDVRAVEETLSEDGEHTVRARATDAAGNVSEVGSTTVRIDTVRPTVTGALDAGARTVSAEAADRGSGIARVEYAIDAPTAWTAYTEPVAVDEQPHRLLLRARDAAGNVSLTASVDVPIGSDVPMEGNVAPRATATASYTSGWNSVAAVNDGSLTGSSWGTWPNVGEQWVQLEWDRAVTLDRAGVLFFRDAADAANAGMIPPREWRLQYRDEASGEWRDVDTDDPYARSSETLNEVTFAPVTTSRLRVLMQAWGDASAQGSSGILEFEAWAAESASPTLDVDVTTTARCVASKATLVVTAANADDAPVTIRLDTPYGKRTIAELAPGSRASQAFSTRMSAMPEGTMAVTLTSGAADTASEEQRVVVFDEQSC